MQYVVKSGDTLFGIAKQFYGNGNLYMDIYNANKQTIGSNPNLIKVGQVLFIPNIGQPQPQILPPKPQILPPQPQILKPQPQILPPTPPISLPITEPNIGFQEKKDDNLIYVWVLVAVVILLVFKKK